MVHSATLNASYIHPSHHSILELWRTFPNALGLEVLTNPELCFNDCICKMIDRLIDWSTTNIRHDDLSLMHVMQCVYHKGIR